jgi:hypothetical protein
MVQFQINEGLNLIKNLKELDFLLCMHSYFTMDSHGEMLIFSFQTKSLNLF